MGKSEIRGMSGAIHSPQEQREAVEEAAGGVSRRRFLSGFGGIAAVTMAAGLVGFAPMIDPASQEAEAAEVGPLNAWQRRNAAYRIRERAAYHQKRLPPPPHPTNGDEELYPNRIGSFSKALPHNDLGEVSLHAYRAMIRALAMGRPFYFEAIPVGGQLRLTNPQAALAFDMEGADSHHLGMIAPPAFSSEEEAGEMAEIYWQALTRDVPFSQHGSDPLIDQAVSDLLAFSGYSGVNPGNVFRGNTPGDLAGPYISQFLWKDIPFGATSVTQRYRVPVSGDDHMTAYQDWLAIQNGAPPAVSNTLDATPRYIRNGRDLGEYVHRDFSYQAYLSAALILLSFGQEAQDDGNPYKGYLKQDGFVTFGGPFILDLVAKVASIGFKAAWYQKWAVHRRLRPEVFGGRIHNHLSGVADYPIDGSILGSQAVAEVLGKYGTFLLPMAYPEGSPTHPAYPAGHATVAGACTTVLKAFFKESFEIPDPQVAAPDGISLLPYSAPPAEPPLTVGGELNKLASNISLGRDAAGVHWRSDGIEGLKLGEAVAISVLRDFRNTYNEYFQGLALTKFDGTTITI